MDKMLNIASLLVLMLSGYTIYSIHDFSNGKNVNSSIELVTSGTTIDVPETIPSFVEDALEENPEDVTSIVLTADEISELSQTRDPYNSPETVTEEYDDYLQDIKEEESEELLKQQQLDKQNEKPAVDLSVKKETYASAVDTFASLYSVNKDLINALIEIESKFEENYINKALGVNRIGLMQVDESVAIGLANTLSIEFDDKTLLDPVKNIQIGTYYLSTIRKENDDIHYLINTYKEGKEKTNDLFKTSGKYETPYSLSVIGKMKPQA